MQELVAAWKEQVRGMWESDVEPMRPERLCGELSDYLPEDAILVSDTGHSGVWTGTMLDLIHPGQSFVRCAVRSAGVCRRRWAPSAPPRPPGAVLHRRRGIWYHLAELETAFKYNLNTVTVVNNNHSLNQEKGGNEGVYGGQTAGSDDLWIFPDADFAAIARSMGCFGVTVNRISELRGALDEAFASGKPAVVDVKTHLDGIAPGAWLPGKINSRLPGRQSGERARWRVGWALGRLFRRLLGRLLRHFGFLRRYQIVERYVAERRQLLRRVARLAQRGTLDHVQTVVGTGAVDDRQDRRLPRHGFHHARAVLVGGAHLAQHYLLQLVERLLVAGVQEQQADVLFEQVASLSNTHRSR